MQYHIQNDRRGQAYYHSGFYDDVIPLTDEERRMIAQVPYDEKEYCDAIGVDAVTGEKGYITLERNSCRPCFDVCGIWGGYTGEGAKTVLPSKHTLKVSSRLVANQNHEKNRTAPRRLCRQVGSQARKGGGASSPWRTSLPLPIDMPAYRTAGDAIEIAFSKQPLAVRSGGSIPIIAGFERILGLKSILMGFGLGSTQSILQTRICLSTCGSRD